MISRVWYGWTSRANADAYEALLKTEIFAGIEQRHLPGYRGIQLLRRDIGQETEFVTEMWFDSLEGVQAFAGKDYEVAADAAGVDLRSGVSGAGGSRQEFW